MSINLFKKHVVSNTELTGFNRANKPNVLFFGDSPKLYTGFAQVLCGIITSLHKLNQYNIKVIGTGHPVFYDNFGRRDAEYRRKDDIWSIEETKNSYIENSFPKDIEILQANWLSQNDRQNQLENDYHGKYKLVQAISMLKVDIVFILNDPYVMTQFNQYSCDIIKTIEYLKKQWKEAGINRKIATIFYYPVDGEHCRADWFKIANQFDIPVTYTNFALDRCKEIAPDVADRLDYIYHGTNTKDFYPMSYDECMKIRMKYFGSMYGERAKDLFLLLNLNRNQPRKDPLRTLSVFSKFLSMLPTEADKERCKLILYMKPQDIGCDIPERIIDFPNLVYGKNVFCMGNYNDVLGTGNNISDINEAYNMCRFNGAGITTTKGEGWGLFLTECYATKLPVFVPNNSVHPELTMDGELGTLVETTKKWGQCDLAHDGIMINEIPRYPVIELDFAQKLLDCYLNYPKYEAKTERAYNWVKDLTWDNVVKDKWLPKFKEAERLIEWKR